MDKYADLEKLADLKQKGIITDQEFEKQKEALLKVEEPQTKPATQPKSRLIYILLALFLGGFGVHNFYAGYTGKGVAQLLLTIPFGILIFPLFGNKIIELIKYVNFFFFSHEKNPLNPFTNYLIIVVKSIVTDYIKPKNKKEF